MKILIVYASAGAGHRTAAEAIYHYLKGRNKDIEISIVDILEQTNAFFRFSYKWGYPFLVNHAIILWQIAFWLTDSSPLRPLTRLIASVLNRINTSRFQRFLIQENPDFIISTHFFSSEIAGFLKLKRRISSGIISIVTDFVVHPFWVSQGIDLYVVASSITKEQLVREGISEACIKEFGIPTDPKFLQPQDKDELCANLSLEKGLFTVLLMTGSFGIGPLEEITRSLYKEVQILVVCAANKKLYASLKSMALDKVKVFGFVDNAQELMSVADIIITKPGGLSISELLIKELVPIFISAIPGQEAGNAAVLEKYGIGMTLKDVGQIKNAVLDLRDHPQKLNSIKDKIRRIRKPDTLSQICNVVCQGSLRPAC